jgi:hypothetical protein
MEQSPQKKAGYNIPSAGRSSCERLRLTGRVRRAWSRSPAALLAMSLLLGACTVAKDEYLVGHVGRATERDVRAKLGDPTFMQPGERGGIRWVYRDRGGWMRSDSGKSAESSDCVEYHLTFDSRSLLTDWTRTGC